MQYEIVLPADYDMAIVERRIAERGTATDDWPGLGLKAYAVRRAGRHGSAVNAYAPFYFWRDPAGLNSFLYGPFRSIATDFGRPPVRHWIGAALHRSGDVTATPVFATREVRALPPHTPPGPAVEEVLGALHVGAGAHCEAVAVDPHRWEVVRHTLWTEPPSRLDPSWTCFDVLHVSAPHLAELPTGRLW
ncbi:DUF4865 family protein [Kineococcus gypseus]|uniref:DUF4865 family protein n=1 Tax=Kineococcus gypseus TaxID=1637102 RepID=UPI003D7E55F8